MAERAPLADRLKKSLADSIEAVRDLPLDASYRLVQKQGNRYGFSGPGACRAMLYVDETELTALATEGKFGTGEGNGK